VAGFIIEMGVGLGPGRSVSVGNGVIGTGVIVTRKIVGLSVNSLVGDGESIVSIGGG
jgi:hypothetical protein